VPFEDPSGLGAGIRELLEDDDARRRMDEACRAFARRMAWPVVGAAYRRILDEVIAERTSRRPVPIRTHDALPGVERRYLARLRAPQGIWQHTVGTQPDPARGTCTDDVARALTVDVAHARARPTAQTSRAVRQDLGYLFEALDRGTRRFRNFRAADGTWLDSPGSEDAHGRALQALGDAAARSSDRWVRAAARRLFLEALPAGRQLAWARPRAYVLLGCASFVGDPASDGRPDHEAPAALHELGEWLFSTMEECPADWPWPEAVVTYDNGVLPEALIEAGRTLERPEWVQTGLDRLEWLLTAQIGPSGVLRPVGNQGWWPRGGRPARFDQQPIEAASLLRATAAAWRATGDPTWRIEMRRAFGWFLGENDLGLPVAVPDIGLCHDGLGREGVSENAGAESTLAWLASVETMRDALAPLTEPALRAAGSGRRRRLHAVPRGHFAQMRQDAAEAADRDADGRIRGTVVDT
jgi:hypothetical protein